MTQNYQDFKDASKIGPRWRENFFLQGALWISKFGVLARILHSFGQSLGHLIWIREKWGDQFPRVHRREQIWAHMLASLEPKEPVTVFELGVAWGYCTNWWLQRNQNPLLCWQGFDRFTGLPRAWRQFQEGAFDAGGNPPPITDKRVNWHIGNVEETLVALDLASFRNSRWIILFDMDLYEPSRASWDLLKPFLLPGDMLYFDEAFDPDEARLLHELLAENGVGIRPIVANPIGIAFEVINGLD
jgi:hypothetical protein